jgi:RNA polymerase sigma-70 factor (ECF subfamily)
MTHDREEALDLAQEALARAFARWGTVSSLDRPDLWLHRVVLNLASSWHRKRRRRPLRDIHREIAEPSPTDDRLVLALQRLSPAQRRVVVLRYCLDQSIDQVANQLGVRPGTIRALAAQGIKRLREELPREALEHER